MMEGKHPDMGTMPGNHMMMTAPGVACVDLETPIRDVKLAHAYVPIQKMCDTFPPMASLKRGTIFPGLFNVYGWESRHGWEG